MLKTFLQEIDSFFERDPSARSRWEIFICYAGLHAVLFHRLANKFHRCNLKFLARFTATLGRFLTGIEIHPAAKIGKNLFIDHGMGVVIGETATIGDNVTIYHGVTLGGVSPSSDQRGEIRHPQIGNNVIIGAGAQLLGAITVGDNARIGSNAVVVSNVPEEAVMVGIPARCAKEEHHKPVFDAYGIHDGKLPDPVVSMIADLSKQVDEMKRVVKEQDEKLAETAEKWDNKRKDNG